MRGTWSKRYSRAGTPGRICQRPSPNSSPGPAARSIGGRVIRYAKVVGMYDFLAIVLPGLLILLTLALVAAIWMLYVVFRQNNGQPHPTLQGILVVTLVLIAAVVLTVVLLAQGKVTAAWVAMAAIGGVVQVVAPLKKSGDHARYLIANQPLRDLIGAAGAGLTIVGSVAAAIVEIFGS